MKSKRVALPYVVWALLFILGPILITLFYAFGQDQFTLDNVAKAFSGDYFAIFLRSLADRADGRGNLPAGGLPRRLPRVAHEGADRAARHRADGAAHVDQLFAAYLRVAHAAR